MYNILLIKKKNSTDICLVKTCFFIKKSGLQGCCKTCNPRKPAI